jgi:anti-sigma factor RsiW
MDPCERWTDALMDQVDGASAPSEALAHFAACPACARELALQRRAVAALDAPSAPAAFRLAAPFRAPIMPRRRERWLLGLAGVGVLGVFLALHGLVDPGPWAAVLSSFGVLTPFSRALFQQAGWAAVLAACAGLATAVWGMKRLLDRA